MEKVVLDRRSYKYKKSFMNFFCPLCRSERAFTIGPRLSAKNYLQIVLMTAFITGACWPFMGWRGLSCFFIIWSGFELVRRILFKKEIPCPHCGFDAAWYKRDVKKARELVQSFWQERGVNASHLGSDKESPVAEAPPEVQAANQNLSGADQVSTNASP